MHLHTLLPNIKPDSGYIVYVTNTRTRVRWQVYLYNDHTNPLLCRRFLLKQSQFWLHLVQERGRHESAIRLVGDLRSKPVVSFE